MFLLQPPHLPLGDQLGLVLREVLTDTTGLVDLARRDLRCRDLPNVVPDRRRIAVIARPERDQ
ncbi:MAG TPA: hypothetical protein VFH56_07680 [Acidimicrobiales bacterium]|nr:hypothetical protein [Acidimicrobiales bacterium]